MKHLQNDVAELLVLAHGVEVAQQGRDELIIGEDERIGHLPLQLHLGVITQHLGRGHLRKEETTGSADYTLHSRELPEPMMMIGVYGRVNCHVH